MTQATTSPLGRPKVSPATIALAVLVVIGLILFSVADLYTDVLWFDQLGFLSVLTTQIFAQSSLFAASASVFALITGISLWLAYKFRPVYIRFPDENSPFEQYRQLLEQLRRVVMIGVPLTLGILAGLAVAPSWGIAVSYTHLTLPTNREV